MSEFPRHQASLEALRKRGRYRALAPRAGHDFASNDYLGLASGDLLKAAAIEAIARGVPVGAGGKFDGGTLAVEGVRQRFERGLDVRVLGGQKGCLRSRGGA